MKRARIDWEQARNRLQANGRALEEALAVSPERIEAAYRLRAVRLAKGQAERKPASVALQVLVLRLAQERYAIELKNVAEVLPFARCTPVPGAPPQFLGVINLRGELRSVLDLARLLVPTDVANRDSGFVLMLRPRGREIGLRVDGVEELREIRSEELALPSQASFVKGVASDSLMLLDVDRMLVGVFSQEELGVR